MFAFGSTTTPCSNASFCFGGEIKSVGWEGDCHREWTWNGGAARPTEPQWTKTLHTDIFDGAETNCCFSSKITQCDHRIPSTGNMLHGGKTVVINLWLVQGETGETGAAEWLCFNIKETSPFCLLLWNTVSTGRTPLLGRGVLIKPYIYSSAQTHSRVLQRVLSL